MVVVYVIAGIVLAFITLQTFAAIFPRGQEDPHATVKTIGGIALFIVSVVLATWALMLVVFFAPNL